MKKIGVTGATAVGKSTVCCLLQECGAYVVDADVIVHQLLVFEDPIGQQIVKLLGSEIITNNQINRKKISNIVFSNLDKLKSIESILHPAVRLEIRRLFESIKDNPVYRFFVAEVPLLYETGMQYDFDVVITVIADPEIVRQRVPNFEECEKRSSFQFSQSVKQARADYVIANQGDISHLKEEITKLVPTICKE